MKSPAWAARVRTFHDCLSVGTMGILSSGFLSSDESHCAAALAFVQLLLGWLLPTFLVARASWRAVQAQDGSPGNGRRPPLTGDARIACWLADWVFLTDEPDGLPLLAWGVLLTLTWMAAGLLAVAS